MALDTQLQVNAANGDGNLRARASREQVRLWFLAQKNPNQSTYHMAYRLNLRGSIDPDRVRRAIKMLQVRHETLRTRFEFDGETVFQVVEQEAPAWIETIDLTGASPVERGNLLDRLSEEFAQEPLPLDQAPLFRCRIVRLDDNQTSLIFSMHHIIGDGWSHSVLTRDFCHGYFLAGDQPEGILEPLPLQFADFSEHQNERLQSPEIRRQVEFWAERLRGFQPLDLPIAAASDYSARARHCSWLVEGDDLSRLKEAALSGGSFLSAILMSAFQRALGLMSGQDEYFLGMVAANRGDIDVAEIIGFFANTLLVPASGVLSGSPQQILQRCQQLMLDVQDNQEAPLDHVIDSLNLRRNPHEDAPVQALFVLQNAPFQEIRIADLEIDVERVRIGPAKVPVTLFATEQASSMLLEIEYDPARVDDRFARDLLWLLREELAALAGTSTEPRQPETMILRGASEPSRSKRTVIDLIWEQARHRPHAIALRSATASLTYADLTQRADAIARGLVARGIQPGERVCTMLERGVDLYTAILGIMRGGMVWAPVDPDVPEVFLANQFAAIGPALIISQVGLPGDDQRVNLASLKEGNQTIKLDLPLPGAPAYAIGTSGSSGVPKVVVVGHAGLANICCWIAETLRLGPEDKGIWKTTIVFDAVMRELFPVLIAGGTLVVARADAQRDMAILRDEIEANAVSTLHCVPTQLRALVDQAALPQCLRAIMSGGEPLPRELAHRILQISKVELYNVYGPTEATVDVTFHRVSGDETNPTIPIGCPVPNVVLALVHGERLLPLTARGELAVGGCAVAHGYLTEDLQRRFRPLDDLGPAYLTGDLAVVSAQEGLQYVGRIDRQIKVNGERMEPGAIEAELLREPGVGEAEIALLKGEQGELAGFVFPHSANSDAVSEAATSQEGSDWLAVFDDSYRDVDYSILPEDNTLGWISSATGEPIPSNEVLDVIEDAARKVRRWQPRRILELGCGIGTLAFRLIDSCEYFVGVDFSASAINYCRHHAAQKGYTSAYFEVADIKEFAAGLADKFDAIVVNSVVQYLPDIDAFEQVLESLVPHLADQGFLFVGDIRDARMRDIGAFWKTRHRRGEDVHCKELLLTALIESLSETELLLHPDSLCNWASRNEMEAPLLEPKYCDHDNELVNFRFDATFCKRVERSLAIRPTTQSSVLNSPFVREANLIDSAIRSPANQPFAKCLGLFVGDRPRRLAEHLSEPSVERRIFATLSQDPRSIEVITIDQSASLTQCIAALGHVPLGKPTNAAYLPNPNCLEPAQWRAFVSLVGSMPQRLSERLPRRLVPHRLVPFPYYPTLPNGKKDQQTIIRTAKATRRSRAAEYPAPGTLEEVVAVVFQNLIGTRFARDDDFFAFGGSSLVATQACNRLQRELGITVPLRLLFEAATPRLLAARIKSAQPDDHSKPLPRADGAVLALSHAQRRLWFIERMGVALPVYNIAHAVRLAGTLNLPALDRAICELCRRHITLRSTFVEINGEPQIRIAPSRSTGNIEVVADCRSSEEACRLLDLEQRKSFDLERGPLFRVIALPLSKAETVLCLICHHIVSDGWSMAIAMQELGVLYQAEISGREVRLDDLEIDYLDLALHDRSAARQNLFAEQIEFWKQEMQGAPMRLNLPYDRLPKGRRSWAGDKITFEIAPQLAEAVNQLALEIRATPFVILLTAFHVLLRNQSQMNDTVIGTVLANRNSYEAEKLVGFLVNSLALRINSGASESFREIVSRAREVALRGFENQDVPFEMVLENLDVERVADYQAVFQVLFALQNNAEVSIDLGGLAGERLRLPPIGAMFDLSLELRPRSGGFEAELEFSSELFDRSTAQRLARHFVQTLTQCLANPDSPVQQLQTMPADEIQRLLRFGHGKEHVVPEFETICEYVQKVAEADPGRACLLDGDFCLTFGQVVDLTRELAGRLDLAGCQRGMPIGISVNRGPLVVVAILAAQWVGGRPAYVDPAYPDRRRQQLMQLASCELAIVDEQGQLAVMRVHDGRIEQLQAMPGRQPEELDGPARCTPDDTAFLAFTSGTTGLPKVVQVPHRAVCGRLQANDIIFGPCSKADRFAHCYSFNYDGGLVCAFWPLTRGIPIDFVPLSLLSDASGLGDFCRQHAISIFDAIPIVVETLVRCAAEVPTLRLVVTGGDSCPDDLFARLRAVGCQAAFANQYGPCEAVFNATTAYYPFGAEAEDGVNIGLPIPGCDIFVVDQAGALAPIGVNGEIWIGGPYLSDGYVNDDHANKTKFVDVTFTSQSQRVFRSGDRGRWLENGELEFSGRVDRQVQINGMRVELGEVEATLRSLPEVDQAVVLVAGRDNVSTLSAFVVPSHLESRAHGMTQDWRSSFDSLYESSRTPAQELLDFTGWTQTASGEDIPVEEMQVWLDDTVEVIKSLRPSRVLEVGCGLGLIALSLANSVEDYVATDISIAALNALRGKADSNGIKLRTVQAEGSEIAGFLSGEVFDVIVINSVVQYLAGYDELHALIGSLIPVLAPDGSIFIGDIRDLRKSDRFYLFVERTRSPELDEATLAQRVYQARLQDEEAHFHPTALGQIARDLGFCLPVVRHKPLAIDNEMTNFRFDAILTRSGLSDRLERVNTIPFSSESRLSELLLAASDPISFTGIPFFDDQKAARKSHPLQIALSIAAQRKWICEVLPDGADAETCMFSMSPQSERTLLWDPNLFDLAHDGPLANQPYFSTRARLLRESVRDMLEGLLPRHMIPPVLIFIDRLPTKPGGKIDETLLTGMLFADRTGEEASRREDLVLAAMTDVWRRLLKVDALFPDSDFFAFGGHSLLAAKLVADIRREFGVQLPVVSIFELRTLRRITAALFDQGNLVGGPDEDFAIAHRRSLLDRLVRNQRQYALWNDALAIGAAHFGTAVRLGRPVAESALAAAIKALADRHPVLEWCFDSSGQLTDELPPDGVLRLHNSIARPDASKTVTSALSPGDGAFVVDAFASDGWVDQIVFRARADFLDGSSLQQLLRELVEQLTRERKELPGPAAYPSRGEWRAAASEIAGAEHVEITCDGKEMGHWVSIEHFLDACAVKTLDETARFWQVTTPALLLGGFANLFRGLESQTLIDCAMDCRVQYENRGFFPIGPYAEVLRFSIEHAALIDNRSYAEACAEQLMDAFNPARRGEIHQVPASAAFSYRTSFGEHDFDSGLQIRSFENTSPHWHKFKLSCVRNATGLALRITFDLGIYSVFDQQTIIDRLIEGTCEFDKMPS